METSCPALRAATKPPRPAPIVILVVLGSVRYDDSPACGRRVCSRDMLALGWKAGGAIRAFREESFQLVVTDALAAGEDEGPPLALHAPLATLLRAGFAVPCCLYACRLLSPIPTVLDWALGRGGAVPRYRYFRSN